MFRIGTVEISAAVATIIVVLLIAAAIRPVVPSGSAAVRDTAQCGTFAATADNRAITRTRQETTDMPPTQKAKAETFASWRTVILPCECLGHMVGRDDELVQFAIEQRGCVQHTVSEVVEVSRTELLSSTDPSGGRTSSTRKAPDLGSSPDTR